MNRLPLMVGVSFNTSMYEDLEEQALLMALQRGWINAEQKQQADQASGDSPKGQWGPRLDSLVKLGILDERRVIELLKDVYAKQQAPSEADPDGAKHTFGRYQNLQLLGTGGMAEVYKAYDPTLGRHVALKFILGESAHLRKRLLMESRSQARIEHEHVCKVYETGEVDGKPYIAMQYINGSNLKALQPRLTLEEKVILMKEVAEAVHAAHRAGLIHRDLKPANILVEREDDGRWFPYVLDFGLAREIESGPGLTRTGVIVGTPWYMSPEQIHGDPEKLDRRSDVYSLGITMYELLAGQVPFPEEKSVEVMARILGDEPLRLRKLNPALPQDLETIVMKCLEKDPARRYDSAKALAEDLDRYREGNTILARRPTLSYRLRVRARKHKGVLAVLAVALLAVSVFGVIGIRAQMNARQRAVVAQRFGQEVERINSLLRIVYEAPIHDVRKEKQIVRGKMKEIESQMLTLGSIAQAPGNYVLGSSYLSLEEPERALILLQKAWDQGYREAEVAYALGLALGQVYHEKLKIVRALTSEEEREHQRKLIETKYRDPAIQHLQAGRTHQMAASEYVEGLIAFYEERYAEAIQKADAALQKVSWLYEADVLKGDVHTALGSEKREKGDLEGALAEYASAERFYRKAIRVGESDAKGYERLSSLWVDVMTAELYIRSGDLQPYFEKAMEASDLALTIDPDIASLHTNRSVAYRLLAEDQEGRGMDSTKLLQGAIESAETAIRLDPKDPFAHQCLGTAWDLVSFGEERLGQDPRPAVQKGILSLQTALGLDPDNSSPYNILCILYTTQALYESTHGIDPTGSYRKSIDIGRKGLELNPRNLKVRTNVGNALLYLSQYELTHGSDPLPNVQQAIDAYQEALRVNPRMSYAVDYLSRSFILRGNCEALAGRDPVASYKKAIEVATRSLELQPDDSFPRYLMWETYAGWSRYEFLTGRNPAGMLDLARKHFAEAIEKNPNLPESYALQALLLAVGIRYEMGQNRSPARVIKEAKDLVSRTFALDSGNARAFLALGEIQMLEALWLQKQGGSPGQTLESARANLDRSIELNPADPQPYLRIAELTGIAYDHDPSKKLLEEGLSFVDRVIQKNPRNAEALVQRGLLLSRRTGSNEAAAEAFKKAVQMNPNLRQTYGRYALP